MLPTPCIRNECIVPRDELGDEFERDARYKGWDVAVTGNDITNQLTGQSST